jgi:hypothetical protein
MKHTDVLFGIVVDTKNVEIENRDTVYSIIRFKGIDIINLTIKDIELSDIQRDDCTYLFKKDSKFVVHTDYQSEKQDFALRLEDYQNYLNDNTILPVYSENGELLYCVGNNIAYYSIKRSLLMKVNAVDLSVGIVSGVDAMILSNRINSNKTLFFGTSLNWDSELSPEVKYGLLNKIGDGVYSFGDLVIIENTMERFVLSENTKCVDIDFTDLGELVCNESLESVCITGGMPDKLYISKNSSEKLICSILYSAMCSDVLSHEALVLKKYMEEKILALDYATLLKDCRLVIYRSIIVTALRGVGIIVY